ncbi:hypothetical protein M440DRAFT_1198288 [Trichoderma longibrachiatum ATCC 18648]|uniref:Uncharacterized protein n=1 Tax=Trichoderma longibrachiatum ATCC 18648 TaxID=983965 RepID=A0A2T4CAT6_TRILO|nr:hypothetical protein M440DRAFT_1198288 [Trichoderma longibrachiatum ATCC 18648]
MGWICLIEYVILECDATSMQCGTVQRAIGDLLILTRQVVPNDEHDAAIRRVRIAPRMRFNMCVSSWHQSPTNVLWASIVANRLKPLPSFDQNGMSGGVDGVLCRSLGAFLLCRKGGCIRRHVCVHRPRLVTSHDPFAMLCRVVSGLDLQLLPACLVLRQF